MTDDPHSEALAAALADLLRSVNRGKVTLARGLRRVVLSAAVREDVAGMIERTLASRRAGPSDVAFDALLRTALSRSPQELGDPGPECLDLAALAAAHQSDAHMHVCARCARAFLDLDVPPPVDPRDVDQNRMRAPR